MRVGILALQGAFRDHHHLLKRLNVSILEVRSPADLQRVERLILPGGESTVMSTYIQKLGLATPIRQRLSEGLPVWGICAGCILLAQIVDQRPGLLNALKITVHRNAYGRHAQSAVLQVAIPRLQRRNYAAVLIRAPKITQVEAGVEIHARDAGNPLFVQQGQVMATTFHPELTDDPLLHEYFLKI